MSAAQRRRPRALGGLLAMLALAACTTSTAPTTSPGVGTLEPTASPTAGGQPSPTADITASPTAEPTGTATPSALPTATATATAEPTPAAAEILRFRREQHGAGPRNVVDCTDSGFGGTIHLVWRIRAASGVTLSIDGPGVYDSYPGTSGAADVPFACEEGQHTYTLATTGGVGGPATLTRTFMRAAPAIVDMAVIGPNCASPADTPPVSVTWEIAHATGVELWVDGQLYATYDGKQSPPEGASAGTFDCSKESQEYTLVSTGGYGTPATMTLNAVP